MKEEKKEK